MTKPYPHNTEQERAILATLIQRPDLIDSTEIYPHHMWSSDHGAILELVQRMRQEGQHIDAVSLGAIVARDEHQERFGGLGYVLQLMDEFGPVKALHGNVRGVRYDYARRQIAKIAEEARDTALLAQDDPAELAASIQADLALVDTGGDDADWVHVSQACGEAVEHTRAVRAQEIPPAFPTGCDRLDRLLGGGLCPGDLTILGARPSMGKTALAAQVARFVADIGYVVGINELEMPRMQIGSRLISSDLGLTAHQIRQGIVNDEQLGSMYQVADHFRDCAMWIDDTGGLSVDQICARARRLQRLAKGRGYSSGLTLLVVDYLQLMRFDIQRGDNRTGAVGDASKALKSLAKELSCHVLALSQLSRQCEQRADKRPMMSDLRDSGAIEQDADNIVFIYRTAKYCDPSKLSDFVRDSAELIVAKQRNGPTGTVPMWWRDTETRFEDMNDGAASNWSKARK